LPSLLLVGSPIRNCINEFQDDYALPRSLSERILPKKVPQRPINQSPHPATLPSKPFGQAPPTHPVTETFPPLHLHKLP
ncbi:MAG: hypothetical protein AAF609_26585, partial [Cyanobacteria bacterium P01_C01_bin.120]